PGACSRTARGSSARRPSSGWGSAWLREGSHRQLDREDRPWRDVVAGPDAAVVVRDDAVHDGQPEARSGLLLGEVGQEQVLLVASLDTDALVGHLDDDLPVPGCIACGHPEMPFAVHRLDGIVKE